MVGFTSAILHTFDWVASMSLGMQIFCLAMATSACVIFGGLSGMKENREQITKWILIIFLWLKKQVTPFYANNFK